MSLRDDIARRLAATVREVSGIAGLSDYEDACDLARADEVIRLMEWARQACGDGPGRPQGLKLTLPPDDWTA